MHWLQHAVAEHCHQRKPSSRRLFEVPSVLHGRATHFGHRWSSRSLHEASQSQPRCPGCRRITKRRQKEVTLIKAPVAIATGALCCFLAVQPEKEQLHTIIGTPKRTRLASLYYTNPEKLSAITATISSVPQNAIRRRSCPMITYSAV